MRHAPSTFHFSHAFRPVAPAGAIEWEELPSLAESLAKRLVVLGAQPADRWDSTRPATLLDLPRPSEAFREPLAGVAVREVTEPDVFRHFFGA